jgi:hypothetical protein
LSLLVGGLCFASLAAAQEPAKLQITSVKLGFNNVYKLGCWTQIEVTLAGGNEPYTGLVEVVTRDPEGVPVSVFTPPERPVVVNPGQTTSTRLFIRPGQDGAALEVRFIDDSGKERAKAAFYPGPEPGGDVIPYGRPATNRIVATFGSQRGVGDLLRGETSSTAEEFNASHAVRIDNAADLPLQWYGYESIDTLVLSGSEPELYRPLSAGSQRIAALQKWVELGGRLVIFCGANAPELIGPDGPLAALVPGKFETLATLIESQPIEAFSGAESPVATKEFRLQVPELTEVEGRILAFRGPNETDLPLVIRARRGFGEITFVGVDPDAAPLADWPGRVELLRQALQWPAAAPGDKQDNSGAAQEDLVDRLRRAMDDSFIGVQTAPFGLVALLVILYILLIGPGDYFFVKRVLGRMELTWLTFPMIVLAVSAGAYWAAHYMKGDQLRVNQVEIVDVDVASNNARGSVITHFFSPRVDRYDLTLQPRFADKPLSGGVSDPQASSLKPQASETLVAWLGSSGYGLDGMRGRRGQTGLFDSGYAFSPALNAIVGLPVQEWSTKTLLGRWSGPVENALDADLEVRDDDLLAGTLTNRTGLAFEELVLMHGNWAYSLPNLASGAVATIDDTLQPSTVKTALTANLPLETAGAAAPQPVSPMAHLRGDENDIPQLAKAMMFHDALGGQAYSLVPNRYLAFVDLSRLLKGDQAILFARAADAAGSQWTSGESELATNQDRRWVYYRFIIPLKPSDQ